MIADKDEHEDDVWKEGILFKIPKPRATADPTISSTIQQESKQRLFRLHIGGKLEYWEIDPNTGKATTLMGGTSILGAEVRHHDYDPSKFEVSLPERKKGNVPVQGAKILCAAESPLVATDWVSALLHFLRGERHLYKNLKRIANLLNMPCVSLDIDEVACMAYFPQTDKEETKNNKDYFREIFHVKFLGIFASNLQNLLEDQELGGPKFCTYVQDSMTRHKISIKPMEPAISEKNEKANIFQKCSTHDGVLCIEFSNNHPLRGIETLGKSLMEDIILNGQPYSFQVKVEKWQDKLRINLQEAQLQLGLGQPMILIADYEEISTAFPEVTPEKYGFTIYDQVTTLLNEAIKRSIKEEGEHIMDTLSEGFKQGHLTIRCKDRESCSRISAVVDDNTVGDNDDGHNFDAEVVGKDVTDEYTESSKEALQIPSYKFEDGSLIVHINNWQEFEKQVGEGVFIVDDILHKLSVGGVPYMAYRQIGYFKPVADKHLRDFQGLLSSQGNFELTVDYFVNIEPLKECVTSSSSSSHGVDEAEICYAEVFYDVYLRSLVDNLRLILLSDPAVGPKLLDKLSARKIQIAPAISKANLTGDRRFHQSRINSEGVLVLEYMQSEYCLSNTHLIGRDLDLCVRV